MSRTVVHLVRHGEVFNPDHVLYGRLPGFRLSELGEQMALQAAKSLAGRDITVVRSSPLERAQQTAQPLGETFGLPVDVDDRLIESANVFEGSRGGWTKPANWRHLTNPVRPSWGEPYSEIAARVLAAARAARDNAPEGKDAVCISHQLPIIMARRAAEGVRLFHDPRKRQCSLASVTSLVFEGDAIVRIDYAEPAASLPAGHGAGA